MIQYCVVEGNRSISSFLLAKSDGGFDIYSNFRKVIVKGICNVKRMSNCFIFF